MDPIALLAPSMAMARIAKPKRSLGRTYLREWREHRGLTQEQAAERLEVSRTLLSKIENSKSPYSQGFLEAAAIAYRCEPADLIMRNPLNPDAVWSITDNLRKASPEKVREAAAIVEALLKLSA